MVEESLAWLSPAGKGEPVFVDATFGAGGHSRAILERLPRSRIIAIDADPQAIERARSLAREFGARVTPLHANFAALGDALDSLSVAEVDGVLYDLGLSSLQLRENTRGFSFAQLEPLDMRLDPAADIPTAADLLATLGETEIAAILYEYGDERNSRRIARQIASRRERAPLRTSDELVNAVLAAQPRGRKRTRLHPATRTFQALRMAVNDEPGNLQRSLVTALARLRSGGRAVVISFHSGEDRIVKRAFAGAERASDARVLTRKPIRPSAAEVAANPRSRSARLRAAEKI